jgi:hypothetical protein
MLHVRDVCRRKAPDASLGHMPLAKRVEEALRRHLTRHDFELDGEDSRRWLRFGNGVVYDSETDAFRGATPEVRATSCVEWAWQGSGLGDAEGDLEDALAAWHDTEDAEDAMRAASEGAEAEHAIAVERAETLRQAAVDRLEALKGKVPDLEFLHSLVGTWQRVFYCLRHQARSVFALPYQEALTVVAGGSNGKSMLATRMEAMLGSYSVTVASEALTAIRDLDSPSQTMLSLKAKRWVSIRELAAGKVKGHVIKTLADSSSIIKARGLYGADQVFRPHWLLYICTNAPMEIDESASKGIERKIRILSMPFHFTTDVKQANDRPLIADLERHFPSWNASLFWLLRGVRRRMPVANCVERIPDEVREDGALLVQESWMESLQEFVAKRLRCADTVEQSASAAEVRAAFLGTFPPNVDKKNVGLRMAQHGFAEDLSHFQVGRKHTSKRTYRYAFPEHGTQLVRFASPAR